MQEIKTVLDRMDLHQLSHFMINGCEDKSAVNASYEFRIRGAGKDVIEKMMSLGLEHEQCEEITSDIFNAFKVYEEVFMELGMKAGAKLCYQLFNEDEKTL